MVNGVIDIALELNLAFALLQLARAPLLCACASLSLPSSPGRKSASSFCSARECPFPGLVVAGVAAAAASAFFAAVRNARCLVSRW